MLFLLIIDLYFLDSTAIAQSFNPITKNEIPIGMLSKEAKEQIEKHPVIAEVKISMCSIYLKIVLSSA